MCLLSIACMCAACASLPRRQGGELPICFALCCYTLGLMEPLGGAGSRPSSESSGHSQFGEGVEMTATPRGLGMPSGRNGEHPGASLGSDGTDGGLLGDTGQRAGGTGLKNKTRGRTCPPRTQKEPFILT